MAPVTVSEENDLMEYCVADASSVKIPAPAGYAERYIHSEIYKRYPGVQSVVHSHSPAVIPYTISYNDAVNWLTILAYRLHSCAFETMSSYSGISWLVNDGRLWNGRISLLAAANSSKDHKLSSLTLRSIMPEMTLGTC
jgi:hypothetical protein